MCLKQYQGLGKTDGSAAQSWSHLAMCQSAKWTNGAKSTSYCLAITLIFVFFFFFNAPAYPLDPLNYKAIVELYWTVPTINGVLPGTLHSSLSRDKAPHQDLFSSNRYSQASYKVCQDAPVNLAGLLLPEKSAKGKMGLKKPPLLFTVLSFEAGGGKWCLCAPLFISVEHLFP